MSLAGVRVLLVEDESQVALLIEAMLEDLGCNVAATAWTLPQAVELAASCMVDLALLDVNLAGERAFPVAEVLRRRDIPFVFVTGYGADGLPNDLKTTPVLAKPFRQDALEAILDAALVGHGRL